MNPQKQIPGFCCCILKSSKSFSRRGNERRGASAPWRKRTTGQSDDQDNRGWPNLQALLRLESARDILFALRAPSDSQKKALKDGGAWASEAREPLRIRLGQKWIARDKGRASQADELWRFVLFSEFVFDLPGALPRDLEMVPRAHEEARSLVEDLCDRLRNDQRTRAVYRANASIA